MTALRALEVAGLVLGKRVLVTGATGGVGRIAIQLARESGAHVTALVRDAAASRELLRRSRCRRRRREPRGRLRPDHRRGRWRDVRPRHRARRPARHRRQHRDPGRRRDGHVPGGPVRPGEGGEDLHAEPLRRARLPRQRGRRPRPALRAHGRGATGRPDRARSLMARACPSARRPPGAPHRRQGRAPRRLIRMKAVVYDRYGPPDVLRIEDVERPVPKEDEVLVRIHATTVTRSDCGARGADPFFARFFTGLSDRSTGSSATSWPGRSRQSAQPSPSSRSATASSAWRRARTPSSSASARAT